MSKVYGSSGQRMCDNCWKEKATTKRKWYGMWYRVCKKCAGEIDEQKKAGLE